MWWGIVGNWVFWSLQRRSKDSKVRNLAFLILNLSNLWMWCWVASPYRCTRYDFRLPLLSRRNLPSSGILCSTVAIPYQCFRKQISPIFKGEDIQIKKSQETSSCIFWPLKMGPICFPEMSVRNYPYMLHNTPEQAYLLWHNLKKTCNNIITAEYKRAIWQPYCS